MILNENKTVINFKIVLKVSIVSGCGRLLYRLFISQLYNVHFK